MTPRLAFIFIIFIIVIVLVAHVFACERIETQITGGGRPKDMDRVQPASWELDISRYVVPV